MFKNNGRLKTAVIVGIFYGLFGFLAYSFGGQLNDVIYISVTPFLAYVSGLVLHSVVGYFNPPEGLFEKRYTLEGIGIGLACASVFLILSLADSSPLGSTDVLFPLIIGTLIGMMWTQSAEYKKLQNRINKFPEFNTEPILCSDSGSFSNSEYSEINGLITLTNREIIFNPSYDVDQETRIELSEIKPRLEKSWVGFLKTPTGIQLTNNQSIQPAKFPRYWLDKINMQKNKL